MPTAQGPNVTDPDARAILNAISSANTAMDYMLCSVLEGDEPNRGEIVHALADALNCFLNRYPAQDQEDADFHAAARAVLGEDPPATP